MSLHRSALFLIAVLPYCASPGANAAEPTASALPAGNLVVNGDFEAAARGWPTSSLKRPGVERKTAEGNTWLAISRYGSVTQHVKLDPNWASIRVGCRMRVTEVVPGREGWHDARLAMSFSDAAGKRLDPWPNVFHARGSGDWQAYDRVFKIPVGAARLELSPSMFGASGKAEFDDIAAHVARLRSGVAADMPLPAGAEDLADPTKALREKSTVRERICLNGLWRFLPVGALPAQAPPPADRGWGWFKTPGIWPRSAGDAQQILLPDGFDDAELRDLEQAWLQRPLQVPPAWAPRRTFLDFTMVQTHARVWIDGREAGEVFFPGAMLEVTRFVKPGARHTLSALVTARPLEKESNVFMAPDRVVSSKAALKCKGLTGDVWLTSQPAGETLDDVRISASTRSGQITFDAAVLNPAPGRRTVEAHVFDGNRVVKKFQACADGQTGRIRASGAWPDAKQWDLHTPQNVYTAVVALRDAAGQLVDETLPIRFGFREFTIDGRDFRLNDSRVHLRALFTTNISSGADLASAEGCRNTCRRLKECGFNALITSNYNFSPGEVGYMDALFDAADAEGVLTTFSLPHVKDFNMKLDDPRQLERYRQLCDWLVRRARNHPSVVMYAMNHNMTGYKGDQNPLWMDGHYAPDAEWAKTNPKKLKARKQAVLAAAVAKELDSTRPVYHHQSGNLGDLYTVNIYLNWAPRQERSDWLGHWAVQGVKPMFFVEWGLPHVSSWSSYRGPEFIWRTSALQQIWDSEYAAAYLGDSAYRMTAAKIESLDWEEELWGRGKPFPWAQLIKRFRNQDENYTQIQAHFAADNWRSHRTWGVSAMLPWDQENLWRTPSGAGRRTPVAKPCADLQKPGISPDAVAAVGQQLIYSRDASQVRPSELGRAFLRWNMPLCAYIGGAAPNFTEKGHIFLPGETVRKQLVILNDTREMASCKYSWSCPAIGAQGTREVAVPAGEEQFVEILVALPRELKPGQYSLAAAFDFGPGGRQEDALAIDVMAPPQPPHTNRRIAVYDPAGQTARLLAEMGLKCARVNVDDPLDGVEFHILGRQALSAEAKLPRGFDRVAGGLKLLVFEQDADALETKLGFRVNIHGLREVFPRTPGHPILAGLAANHLRDWRGAATIVPPHLDVTSVDQNDPKWKWSGFENTRVWRCGNLGSVATVLIEKPDRSDFLPIVDGGFDLQYAPLLEWRLGAGRVVFCQMDVTGRTQSDPAAATLCANLIRYLDKVQPAASRIAYWAGDHRAGDLLKQLGIAARPLADAPQPGALLVLGPGASVGKDLRRQVEAGLDVLALGLDEKQISEALPGVVQVATQPGVSQMAERFADPLLMGLSNADLHWRTKLTLATLPGADQSGSPALRVVKLGRGRIVFCQAAPWMFDFDQKGYLRTTTRRNTFLVARLLHNLNAAEEPPLSGPRYVQTPQAGDDPYRYYRW